MKSAWMGLGVAIWLAGCAAAGGVDGVGGEGGGSFESGAPGGAGDEGGSGGSGGTGGSGRDGIPDSFVDAVTASLSGDALAGARPAPRNPGRAALAVAPTTNRRPAWPRRPNAVRTRARARLP